MKKKVLKVIDKGYITRGKVLSLIDFFSVPKEESDIRSVHDCTKSRLNDVVWAPMYFLPSIDSMLMSVDFNT